MKRPVEAREPVLVHTQQLTGKGSRQIAATFEQVECALDVPVTAELPLLVLEEELAHASELPSRLDLVGLLGPMPQSDCTGCGRLPTIRLELDVVEVNERAVQLEGRFHVRPEGHV